MALSYKARKRLSYLILTVGLLAYIVAVVTLVTWLPRLPVPLEFIMYVFFGVAWVFPLKSIFKGTGQADPDAPKDEG